MNTVRDVDPKIDIALAIEQDNISFEDAENRIAVYSPQLSDEATGLIGIGILEVEKLLAWAPEDASWFAVPTSAPSSVSLGFLVFADSDRPAARFYYTNTSVDSLRINHLHNLTELLSLTELLQHANADGYAERLADYRKQNSNPQTELLKKFYEGRICATTTQAVDILDTDGLCLVCKEPALNISISTTISNGDQARTLVLSLCREHKEESEKGFIFDFLAAQFGLEKNLNIRELTSDDVYLQLEEVLGVLECDDIKRGGSKVQVSGTRKSGMNVILRCEQHTDKPSYAYMFTTPSSVNLRRVDNAQHHSDQSFLWDHKHLGLPNNNSDVAPSFTCGLASLDIPTIRSELEIAEMQMRSQN
nr:hypothetical protein [uncultured Deefgea sp.]